MNSERDHQPRGPAGARPSASDPPVPGPPPPSGGTAPAQPPDPALPETEPPADPRAPKAADADADASTRPGPRGDISPEEVREHLRRRAAFLRELAEARELRRRVTPHRSRRERLHAVLRRRTFRIN